MEKEEEAPTSPFFRSKMTLSETLSGVYNRLSGGVEEEDVRFENYRQHKLDAYMSLRGAQCDETKRWISMDMAREGMINGYLYGRPVGTASKPVIKDPKGKHWVCKHVYAILNAKKGLRFASAGSTANPIDALDLSPLPDPVRVAYYYARENS